MIRSGTAKGEQIAARLQYAQALGPKFRVERYVAAVPSLPHKPARGPGERPVGAELLRRGVRAAESLHYARKVVRRVGANCVDRVVAHIGEDVSTIG